MGVFEELYAVNVNEHTEGKKTGENGKELTYLSWTFAWAETKKRYPNASYTVWKDEKGLPYAYDNNTGYIVYTSVTIEGITHEMWLPVMDGKNKAMKSSAYKYLDRWGKEKIVEQASMFDINKTIMRCLTKNLAMFGLGLYIYAGEDLPEDAEEQKPKQKDEKVESVELRERVIKYCTKTKMTKDQIKSICSNYGVNELKELSNESCMSYIAYIQGRGGNI